MQDDPMTPDANDGRLSEDRNWVASTGLNRRGVLVGGAFAAGFAAACQPVSATTIRTDSHGIVEQSVSLKATDGFAVPLFVAKPAGTKPAPVIIVVHEIFGVHEWIKDICRRFAKEGYCAVAPDLFARHGDATKITDFAQLRATIVSKASDAQVMADIDSSFAWASKHGGDAGRHGITGFCWGGRIVWLYAAHSKALDAGVAFYGQVSGKPATLQPASPMDEAARIAAPVLGQYGAKDKGIPVSDLEAFKARLKELGKSPPSDITIYPDADHGFMADYRPSYNEPAAKEAWAATLGWFGKYVKA
ncbi:dienelactone hydrolase family protein [Sphingobium sp. SCG-1]|uniref:dienelactone hydrolase family protein n=1 Tax=Sphingobium sp. SCG-1 TaxID=2072936 RepID=UPI001CB99306|nr:dienelactone hydrolase family protein [Sphingobium sp. SCG-1]